MSAAPPRQTFPVLPWWRDDGLDGDELLATAEALDATAISQDERDRCVVAHIVTSNVQEGTMPMSTSTANAVSILTRAAGPAAWADAGAVAQLDAHMRAVHLLSGLRPVDLDVDTLAEVHATLMCGARMEDTGDACPMGLRTVPVHANGRFFMDAQDIRDFLLDALDRHRSSVSSAGDALPARIAAAAALFRDVVHVIHPFVDGNGRLGRMLVACSLRSRLGLFLPLTNGHRKPRKKYEAVISRVARTLGDSAGPLHTQNAR